MNSKALTLITISIILISLIPCLASQHPEEDEDYEDDLTSEHGTSRHHENENSDLEGPYTLNNKEHHRNNGRNDKKSRHGNRKSRHRSHDHSNRRKLRQRHREHQDSKCEQGFFWNRSSEICIPCSSCPTNQIIRTPCHGQEDTICGPFHEFLDQQKQKYDPSKLETLNDQGHSIQSDRASHDVGDAAGEAAGKAGLEGKAAADKAKLGDAGVGFTKGPTVQNNADQWRELCYGLIGALAVVTLLAVGYIVITQIQARRQAQKYPDSHCRTGLAPTMRVFANGFLGTTDYQKITPIFENGRSRRSQNWLLRHLKRSLTSRAEPNAYVIESDVRPEAVEMDHIQGAAPPVLDPRGQDEAQGHAAQGEGHVGQGQRLESTQSWDSGIGTHEPHRQV